MEQAEGEVVVEEVAAEAVAEAALEVAVEVEAAVAAGQLARGGTHPQPDSCRRRQDPTRVMRT